MFRSSTEIGQDEYEMTPIPRNRNVQRPSRLSRIESGLECNKKNKGDEQVGSTSSHNSFIVDANTSPMPDSSNTHVSGGKRGRHLKKQTRRKLFHFLDKNKYSVSFILYQSFIIILFIAGFVFAVVSTSIEIQLFSAVSITLEVLLLLMLVSEYTFLVLFCTVIPDYAYDPFKGRLSYICSYKRVLDFIIILSSTTVLICIGLFHRQFHSDYILVPSFIRLIRIERFVGVLPLFYKLWGRNYSTILPVIFVGFMCVLFFSILIFYVEEAYYKRDLARGVIDNVVDTPIERALDKKTFITSMPEALYWGFITATTVGYGDNTAVYKGGKFIASFAGICGVWIFAVPAGLIGAALAIEIREKRERKKENKMRKNAAALVVQEFIRALILNKTYGAHAKVTRASNHSLMLRAIHFSTERKKAFYRKEVNKTTIQINTLKKLDYLLLSKEKFH